METSHPYLDASFEGEPETIPTQLLKDMVLTVNSVPSEDSMMLGLLFSPESYYLCCILDRFGRHGDPAAICFFQSTGLP